MWKTTDKLKNEVTFDICEEKCQTETVKKILKNLSKSQLYTVGVKFLNMHTFSLEMYFFDILNSEEETEKKLININAAHQ